MKNVEDEYSEKSETLERMLEGEMRMDFER